MHRLFTRLSLRPTTDFDGRKALGYQLGKQCFFDISIRDPRTVVHVTSYPGYKYEPLIAFKTPEKTTNFGVIPEQSIHQVAALVTYLSKDIQSDTVLQVILTTPEGSDAPVYLEIPPGEPDPVDFLIQGVLRTLRLLADRHPDLRGDAEKHFHLPGGYSFVLLGS